MRTPSSRLTKRALSGDGSKRCSHAMIWRGPQDALVRVIACWRDAVSWCESGANLVRIWCVASSK